jgi:Flp pilus assembly pilin Flp
MFREKLVLLRNREIVARELLYCCYCCELRKTMKRLLNDKGQGTLEYTLLIGLVVVVVWAVIRNTGIVQSVSGIWGDVNQTIPSGTSNSPGSSSGGSVTSNDAGGGAGANSARNSTSVSRNVGNSDPVATHQLTEEERFGEQKSDGGDNSQLPEPTLSRSNRAPSGVSNIFESQWNNLYMGLGLALFVLIASVIPLIVWMRIKSIEKGEISFQGLQAEQIVAKIKQTA